MTQDQNHVTKNLESGESYVTNLSNSRTRMYKNTKQQERYAQHAETRRQTFAQNAPKNPLTKLAYYGYKRLKLDK